MDGSLQRIIALTICRLCAAASRGRKPFARHPIKRLVERARQAIEQLFDFGRADDERRRQRHHIAHHRAHDQAFVLAEADGGRADTVMRIERTLGPLVGDQFQAANEPEPARFAVPATRLGLSYPLESIERLVHVVGPTAAADILLSARALALRRSADARRAL